jgi:hypothetical protein
MVAGDAWLARAESIQDVPQALVQAGPNNAARFSHQRAVKRNPRW